MTIIENAEKDAVTPKETVCGCRSQDNKGLWTCSRTPGHRGPHIAGSWSGKVYATWRTQGGRRDGAGRKKTGRKAYTVSMLPDLMTYLRGRAERCGVESVGELLEKDYDFKK